MAPYPEYVDAFWLTTDERVAGLAGIAGAAPMPAAVAVVGTAGGARAVVDVAPAPALSQGLGGDAIVCDFVTCRREGTKNWLLEDLLTEV